MSRNKSKQSISFPPSLDMAPFMDLDEEDASTPLTYELRGVLLHKGASAYHGHYESQVYDARSAEPSGYSLNDG